MPLASPSTSGDGFHNPSQFSALLILRKESQVLFQRLQTVMPTVPRNCKRKQTTGRMETDNCRKINGGRTVAVRTADTPRPN